MVAEESERRAEIVETQAETDEIQTAAGTRSERDVNLVSPFHPSSVLSLLYCNLMLNGDFLSQSGGAMITGSQRYFLTRGIFLHRLTLPASAAQRGVLALVRLAGGRHLEGGRVAIRTRVQSRDQAAKTANMTSSHARLAVP